MIVYKITESEVNKVNKQLSVLQNTLVEYEQENAMLRETVQTLTNKTAELEALKEANRRLRAKLKEKK